MNTEPDMDLMLAKARLEITKKSLLAEIKRAQAVFWQLCEAGEVLEAGEKLENDIKRRNEVG